MCIINKFDVSGTIHQFCMYGLFGVRTWCKWALESDSPWLMWTRIPYSARIGLLVRQYVGEAARKPILPLRKKTEKTARNATEFLISVDLGKVWPPLVWVVGDVYMPLPSVTGVGGEAVVATCL